MEILWRYYTRYKIKKQDGGVENCDLMTLHSEYFETENFNQDMLFHENFFEFAKYIHDVYNIYCASIGDCMSN